MALAKGRSTLSYFTVQLPSFLLLNRSRGILIAKGASAKGCQRHFNHKVQRNYLPLCQCGCSPWCLLASEVDYHELSEGGHCGAKLLAHKVLARQMISLEDLTYFL